MQIRPISVGAALLALALGCAARPTPESQRLAQGRAEYETYCVACHGPAGAGDGPVAPYMRPPPADLRKIAARRGGVFPDAQIQAWIDGRETIASHGTRDMPIWGNAFRAETELDAQTETRVRSRIALLVSYLRSIQQP